MYTTILLASILVAVDAQRNLAEFGLGPAEEPYLSANKNPLNKTQITFTGFNFSANPANGGNDASAGQWTWNAGLSIVDLDTNRTNYPIASASDSTSNVLSVGYSLDFPQNQLPAPNSTDWIMCSYLLNIPWTSSVLKRAPKDPGNCSVVLGTQCLSAFAGGMQKGGPGAVGCPILPSFTSYSECSSISTNGYSGGSGEVSSLPSDPNNINSTRGLSSGDMFSFELSTKFNASDALANYDEFASYLRMTVLTFSSNATPNVDTSTWNAGTQVRTFCAILNSAGNHLDTGRSAWMAMAFSILLFIWEVIPTWNF